MGDLSDLLMSSRALTSNLARPDLPTINFSLDQIEAQSRRLVARQAGASGDHGKGNYLLAKANVDAPTLGTAIAALNTAHTFAPLNPLHDTDVAGYLRHAHEQSLISSIEEGRRETGAEFYRLLDDRVRKDWEARKKKIFEELGVSTRVGSDLTTDAEGIARFSGEHAALKSQRAFGSSLPPQPVHSLAMHAKMMSYDRVITQLNNARLGGAPYSILHALSDVAVTSGGDTTQFTQMLHILSTITFEPPAVPPSHSQAHILNTPLLERAYARAYQDPPESPEAIKLRKRIAEGARRALEQQLWDILERTLQQNVVEAALGGDPAPSNKVRAYLSLRFYKNGRWEDKLEMIGGTPLWAKIFYLVRSGHIQEALQVVTDSENAINQRERSFVTFFKAWAESADRSLPANIRERLMSSYNSHILHAPNQDPFKMALFKLMGRIDPQRRSIPLVTATTEDWMWFQLAMVDEDDGEGLAKLGAVLENYGKKYFENPQDGNTRKGVWARLLLVCGLFEKAVAALYETVDLQIEAIHLAIALSYYGLLRVTPRQEASDVDIVNPSVPPTINFPALINRYIRQFQRTDPKEALQYVYCLTLNAEKSGANSRVGEEQIAIARDMTKRVVLGCDGKWEELVGAFREDGSKYPGLIEHNLPLLALRSTEDYHALILRPAAEQCASEHRLLEAIKLYNLAGEHTTVIQTLTRALGDSLAEPDGNGEEGRALENLARTILEHYSRRGEVSGRQREELVRLLKIREAMEAYDKHRFEAALDAIEASNLLPLRDDSQSSIHRIVEEFKERDEAITRNLGHILILTMNILHSLFAKAKHSVFGDGSKQTAIDQIRKKRSAIMTFAGSQRYRLGADVYAQLNRLDVAISH